MKPSVPPVFIAVSSRLEGVVPWMYLDILGLVTTGIGNLIDPLPKGLPFTRADGTSASGCEIEAEWRSVKSAKYLAKAGHLAAKTITQLRLTPEGLRQVVTAKMAEMEAHLKRRFPPFETWPADAQLATMSMAWACGPGFRFPALAAALLAGDFVKASATCHINETGNQGVIPRNVMNKRLYLNAARTTEPDEVHLTAIPAPAQPESMSLVDVQKRLAVLGYNPGPSDGVMGPKTRAAIVSFQRAAGLVTDGVAGPKTRAALSGAQAP